MLSLLIALPCLLSLGRVLVVFVFAWILISVLFCRRCDRDCPEWHPYAGNLTRGLVPVRPPTACAHSNHPARSNGSRRLGMEDHALRKTIREMRAWVPCYCQEGLLSCQYMHSGFSERSKPQPTVAPRSTWGRQQCSGPAHYPIYPRLSLYLRWKVRDCPYVEYF